MATELEWVFRMQDQFSGSAGKISKALKGVNKELDEMKRLQKAAAVALETDPAKKKMGELEIIRDKLAAQGQQHEENNAKIMKGAAAVGAVAAAATAAAVAVAAIGVAFSGAVIQAAAFKRDTLSAFTVLTGSKEEAKSLYTQIDRIADISPFDTAQVSNSFRALLGGGMKRDEIEKTLLGVYDVGAIIGGEQGAQASQSIIQQMLQVRSIGKLAYEDLKQISQASGGLIPIDKVAANLAQVRHVTAAEAMKMISTGAITAAEGQKAILDVIQSTADGGEALGTASKKFGTDSLSGQLSTLKSRWDKLFEDVDITPIIKALDAINGLFNTESGLKAKTIFTDMFSQLFAYVAKFTEGNGMERFLDTIVETVQFVAAGFKAWWSIMEALWDGLKVGFSPAIAAIRMVANQMKIMSGGSVLPALIDGLKTLWTVLGFIVGVAAAVVVGIAGIGLAIQAALVAVAALPGVLWNLGDQMMQGLFGGIETAFSWVGDKFAAMLQVIPDTVRSVFGIHSPSTLMFGFGTNMGEGLLGGLSTMMPDVQSTIDGMAMPRLGGIGAVASNGGGAASMNFGDLSFSFAGGPKDAEEAKQYGKTAALEFRAELARQFAGAAIEAGAG